MAANRLQNRRYQAALRKVLARFRAEQPDLYRAWLDAALTEYDQRHDSTKAVDAQQPSPGFVRGRAEEK